MNRREFSKKMSGMLLFAAGAFSITMTGCNVFDDILSWIPVGIAAIDGVVTVLGPLVGPGPAAIIALIKGAFADLVAAVTQYRNDANPADKATLVAKIRTLLSDIVTNFQSFLNALNLGANPIVTIVIGLANVILSTIAGFMNQLPQPAGTKSMTLASSVHVGAQTMRVVPKHYKNVGDFKHEYNAVCSAGGHPEISLK